MILWIKNTSGKEDAVLTMTFIGFLVVIFKVLFAGVVLKVAGHEITFGTIDAAVIGALLTPTLGAYVARKYTDRKFGPDGIEGTADDEQEEAQASTREKE